MNARTPLPAELHPRFDPVGYRGLPGVRRLLWLCLLLPVLTAFPASARALAIYEAAPRPVDLHPFMLGSSPAGLHLSAFLIERLGHVDEARNDLELPLFEPPTPGSSSQHVLRLKKGLTFSDGRPLTAADVVGSLSRLRAAADRSGASPSLQALAHCFFLLERATARDARQVLFTFDRPVLSEELAAMLASLPVFPADARDDALRDGTAPSLAPYTLERRLEDGYRLAANPRYPLGVPLIPAIEVHYVTVDALSQRLQSDGADEAFVLPPELVGAALSRTDLELRVANSRRVLTLGFDQHRGSRFADQALRRAVAAFLDRQALLDAIPMPPQLRTPLIGPYAPDRRFAALQKDIPEHHYDPETGRAGLKALGYARVGETLRDARGRPLSLRLWVDPRLPSAGVIGGVLTEQLRREGLEVALEPEVRDGQPDLVLKEWLLDEDEGYYEILHSRGIFNDLQIRDGALDELVGLERRAMLLASRERYRREIQTRLVETAAMVFFWQRRDTVAFRTGVRGGAALDPYYVFRSVHTWTIDAPSREVAKP